jgi:hypothetical protein
MAFGSKPNEHLPRSFSFTEGGGDVGILDEIYPKRIRPASFYLFSCIGSGAIVPYRSCFYNLLHFPGA